MSRSGTYGSGGAGQPDRGGGDSNSSSSSSSSSGRSSRPGQPDRPGTSDDILREHGVSERDIKAGGSSRSRRGSDAWHEQQIIKQRPGQPDAPGEATQKMIDAGVMHPSGEMKQITGYYKDPLTGHTKFIAAGEPKPVYKVPSKNIPKDDVEKAWYKEIKDTEIRQHVSMIPDADNQYSSGTAWQSSVFDPAPIKQPSGNIFTDWYARQQTKVGLGGEAEGKSYEQSVKEYEILQFSGSADKLADKAQELQDKYSAYESARGTSPLAGKGIKTEKTFAHKAHKAADTIRADKPTYGGWQGDLSRVLNEAIASNVEFLGGMPTLVRYGVPELVKSPSMAVALGAVGGGEMLRSIAYHPVQSAATMAVTGGVIKGGAKIGKGVYSQTPKPMYKGGVAGIQTPKGGYRGLFDLKSFEYMIETPKHLKGGAFKTPAKASKPSVESVKIQDLMPEPISKQLIVRPTSGTIKAPKIKSGLDVVAQAKDVIKKAPSKSDIAYKKSVKESRDSFIKETQRNIMEREAIKVIQKTKKVSDTDFAYYRARAGIKEDIITQAKQDIMMKDVIGILSRGTKFKSGVDIGIPKLSKMGTRYKVEKPYREPSTYKLPSVKKQEIGVDVKGAKIRWEDYQKSSPGKSSKSFGIAPVFITGLFEGILEKPSVDKYSTPFSYKKSDTYKQSKKRTKIMKGESTKTIPKFKPQTMTLPKELTKTDVKDMYKSYIPDISDIPIKSMPKEKPIKTPKIAIPLAKRKARKKSKKGKTSKVKKVDIKNPIATVDQFMFKVM